MNATIAVTNLLSRVNTLRLDGLSVTWLGGQTLPVDVAFWANVLQDAAQGARARTEFSAPAATPAAPAGERAFSATVDLTVSPQTVNVVPAIAGRSWVTKRTRITVASSSGSPTAADVSLKSGGNVMQGYSIDGTGPGPGWSPPIHLAQWATPTGGGVDVAVDAASTGGALSVTFELRGEYL